MRPRAAEIRAITELLEAEHPDVDQLAKDVLQLAWELFDKRERFVLVLDQPAVGVAAYGPAGTRNEIHKAIGTQIVSAGPGPATGHITPLIPLGKEHRD